MLIRSQDKRILINMNNVSSIEVGDNELRIFAADGETIYDLGSYSTKAKAMKVLDMIQEAYADAELVPRVIPDIGKMFTEASPSKENELLAEVIGKMANNAMVFQIPSGFGGGSMSDGMTLVQNEDGSFSAYDDSYDVVIHCETEEEQKKVIERLKAKNWIPVSERLPEIKKNYLECYLVTDGRFCWMAYFASEQEWVFAECTDCKNKIDWADVVAWMPLPELYKEDEP